MPGSNGDAPLAAEEVTLIDETGAEQRFRLHDAFDLDGGVYYLVENVEDADQVLLLRETAEGLETVEGEEMEQLLDRLEREDHEEPPEEEAEP